MERTDHPMFESDLVWRAYQVAEAQHATPTEEHPNGQRRKYIDAPYIVHPFAVAEIIWNHILGVTDEVLAATLLHDTVEDTPYTIEELTAEFGPIVGYYVFCVTDISRSTDGNREARKLMDAEHYARGPAEAQSIKVADLMDNTKSISEYDPNFWVVYLKEKERLLDMLTKAYPSLILAARCQIQHAKDGAEYQRLSDALKPV